MYKYYKTTLLLVAIFFLSACMQTPKPVAPNQKAFAKEDLYIVYALHAEEIGRFDIAADLYAKLYDKSLKKEYLYKEIQNMIQIGKFDKAIALCNAHMKKEGRVDENLLRLKTITLVHKKELQKAKENALWLIKLTKKEEDYLLLADIYVKLKKYEMAIKYLEGAYSKNYDPKILDRISIILFVNLKRPKEAIAQLETYTRMFECNEYICNRLLSFYSKLGNIDGMLSVYKRMYEHRPSDEILNRIIKIYVYKKDYIELKRFLESHNIENEVLLQIYSTTKEYKKASLLAYKLYKKTSNIDFLAQGALYEFESYKNPPKKVLKRVVKYLKKVVKEKATPLYLNYLGYLLIDKNINIKEGMKYVKKALAIEPDSAFYLDSLAWGYYKLGKCKKAEVIFKKVVKLEGGDDKEVLKHIKKVKQCMKGRR